MSEIWTRRRIEIAGLATILLIAALLRLAAPIILRTGLPALAVGGYLSNDPILSTDGLAAMVAAGCAPTASRSTKRCGVRCRPSRGVRSGSTN